MNLNLLAGNFTSELERTQTHYQTRLNETLDAFRTAMSIAYRDVWRCDPPEWIGNELHVFVFIPI